MPQRGQYKKGSPDSNELVCLANRPVLAGGCLAKPIVVEPIEEIGDETYCKVTNNTTWFTLFVCGCVPTARVMTSLTWMSLIRQKLREHELRGVMKAGAVADLGMDDDECDTENRHTRSAHKRRKAARISDPVVEVEMPTLPQSEDFVSIRVLNKNLRDGVWLKCDTATLSWARSYVRSELELSSMLDKQASGTRDAADAEEVQEMESEAAKWCSRASCWRIKRKGQTRNFYVARTPEETFQSRSSAAKMEAMVVYEQWARDS